MASKTAILAIRILSDAKNAQKGFIETATALDKFEAGLGKLVKPAALAGGAVLGLAAQSIQSAKKLELSTKALEHFFRDCQRSLEQLQTFATTAYRSVGMYQAQAQKSALQFAMALQNAGIPAEQLADTTEKLMKRAADLSVSAGVDVPTAMLAMQSALQGNYARLNTLGAGFTAAEFNARAYQAGIHELEGECRRLAETQLRLDMIMERSVGAYGLFAAEADTAAMTQQRMRMQMETTRAELGMRLLPAVTRFYELMIQGTRWVSENSETVFRLGVVVGGVSGGILALNAALKTYKAISGVVKTVMKAKKTWSQALAFASYGEAAATTKKTAVDKAALVVMKAKTATQKAFNLAMKANPVGIIIAAVIALIAAIVLLIKNWETVKAALITGARKVRDCFVAAWQVISDKASKVWAWIRNTVQTQLDRIRGFGQAIRDFFVDTVWAWIRDTATTVWNAIRDHIQTRIDQVQAIGQAIRDFFAQAWQAIRDTAYKWFNKVRDVVDTALTPVRVAIDAVRSAFDSVVSVVQSVIDWINKIRFPSMPSWMENLFGGRSLPSPEIGLPSLSRGMTPLSPRFARTPILATSEPQVIVNLTVNGFVGNALELGREIERCLGKFMRHNGQRTFGQTVIDGYAR